MAERAISHAISGGHQFTLAHAHFIKGVYEAVLFNVDKVLAHAQAIVAIGREKSMPAWVAHGTSLEAWARWRSGERTAGSESMFEGRRLHRKLRDDFGEPLFGMQRAEALAETDPEGALRNLEELLDSTSTTGQRWLDTELHRRCGEILVRHFPQRVAAAEEAFGQALAVSRAQQTRSFELRASLDLARLYHDTNRDREARDLLAPALVGFTETPELPEIAEAQRLLASLGTS